MEQKISWDDCIQLTMSIAYNKLKSLEIRTIGHQCINADIKDFANRVEREIFHIDFAHDICKYLYIKGLNYFNTLEIAKDYLDNMGIQYDGEIFGE